jgi:hypothetical protein
MANGKWQRSEVGLRTADHGQRSGRKAETEQKLEMRCDREIGQTREKRLDLNWANKQGTKARRLKTKAESLNAEVDEVQLGD